MSMSVLYDAPGPKTKRNSTIASVIGAVAILAGLTWIVLVLAAPRTNANGAEQPGMFDPSRLDILSDPELWGAFGRGALATLQMAGAAAVLAIVVGILFSFGRTSASKWIRIPTSVLLEFFRGMPLLLLILFVSLLFSIGSYWAGVLGLAIYNGAIIGEALRAGIISLPRGQREGGLSVGLTSLQTRFIIEFPQAFRQMLPIILAQLVVLLKDTSLAYIVAYPELARTIKNLQNFYGSRYLFTLFAVGFVIYLVMNLTLSYIARYAAKRSGPKLGKITPDTPKVPGAEGTRAITMQRGNANNRKNSSGGVG
ncbi:amino acid ABC transporter permease [Salinibacterium sp. NSLL150]|uniref:amino acid ABC transporter permease n=1 Tax=unclassified Salinibacterium TaxID=2632331 RepID=UPI0018CF477B|nr:MULTISPECIES: amino acid ABC transporter permease [unclassified Salinibacterium]MBH0100048.1 amino acid ABC transporter permease [Salinibacterium sp. NSLL35]MBH0102802.1 amino acid ABC transporter permease [Salinibacterium sp. NSLL150]MBH0105562.1 amino acid ABC transporter permease [Salinibacterium sp. NSLL16]MBH0108322.1 amino acid ABC transporter permease [Salinibacterium sp. NSLL17]MBH0131603.1 amino acid ABC transporter permease [Salinibacterium sp. NK8237]